MSATAPVFSEALPVTEREAAALFAGLAGEARLLVAVSGGPDSVALLVLLAEWARAPGRPALHAATVDHGLRPASAGEASVVAALCERLGVPHATLVWDGPKPVAGLQAKAREARYDLLGREALRLGGAVLVSAHTLDDQAETVLMRMAHGSGPSGLIGMRERVRKGSVELARPLLGIAKARLIATLEARGLAFVRDPSNEDMRFERVRWRQVLPALAEEGLTAERLARLARRMARLEDVAERRAATLLREMLVPDGAGGLVRFDIRPLLAEPEEIVLRVLAQALAMAGPEPEDFTRLERLESCAAALIEAARAGVAATRTLSGCLLSLAADGTLTLRPEGTRRRGVRPATP